MRKTLLCGSVALAAAVSLAILDAAQHTRTPTPTLNHGPTEALAPAANSDIGSSPTSAGSCANEGWRAYSNPKFSSRKSCELWVRKHIAPSPVIGNPPPEKNPGSTEVRTAVPFLALEQPCLPGSPIPPDSHFSTNRTPAPETESRG